VRVQHPDGDLTELDAYLAVDAPRLILAIEMQITLVEKVNRIVFCIVRARLPTNAASPVIDSPTISELISRCLLGVDRF
jgi:hypothetical protein